MCDMRVQSKKLDSEVLAPMQRWTTAYNTVLVRSLLCKKQRQFFFVL